MILPVFSTSLCDPRAHGETPMHTWQSRRPKGGREVIWSSEDWEVGGEEVMGSAQICIHIRICMQIYIKICMHTPRVHHSKQNHTRLQAWGGVGRKMSSLQLHSHISMASGDANRKPTDPGNVATISTELMTEQYRSFGTKNGQESGCYSGQEKELEESNIGLTISSVLI